MLKKIAFFMLAVSSLQAQNSSEETAAARQIVLEDFDFFSVNKVLQLTMSTGMKWERSQKDKNSFSVPLNFQVGVVKAVQLKLAAKTYRKETDDLTLSGLKSLKLGISYNYLKLKDIGFESTIGMDVGKDTTVLPSVLLFEPHIEFNQSYKNFGVQLGSQVHIDVKTPQEIETHFDLAPYAKFGNFAVITELDLDLDKNNRMAWSIIPGMNWFPGLGFKLGLHTGFGLNANAPKYSINFSIGHVFELK